MPETLKKTYEKRSIEENKSFILKLKKNAFPGEIDSLQE